MGNCGVRRIFRRKNSSRISLIRHFTFLHSIKDPSMEINWPRGPRWKSIACARASRRMELELLNSGLGPPRSVYEWNDLIIFLLLNHDLFHRQSYIDIGWNGKI